MSRNLIILIIIFAVLIGLAMFVLIPGRGDDTATEEGVDAAAAAQTATDQAAAAQAETAGKVSEDRQVEGQTVTVNYVADKLFVTESEQNGFAQRPVDEQQTQTEEPAATVVVEQTSPTATPVPQQVQVSGGITRTGDPIIFRQYTVAAGDTMYSLSVRTDFDTSIGLMALYGIDTSDIVNGNLINLPIVNPNYCGGARATHLILEGETVFRIADKYGTSMDVIAAANGLGADYRIRTNDVLCIP